MVSLTDDARPVEQSLEDAIFRTVAYSDVFDYPLTPAEIQRYLVSVVASLEQVQAALDGGGLIPSRLDSRDGCYFLPGRERLIDIRRERAQVSALLWPRAIRYGHIIARMPFVRMVAITGALAMDSSYAGDDLDYFVVTEPGHLWLCRAFIIGLVRAAAIGGDVICPNYFVSSRALALGERNLYTAHEMTQMVPVAGLRLYDEMRSANRWVEDLLPNAQGAPRIVPTTEASPSPVWALTEALLRTPSGARLERWEMERKSARLRAQVTAGGPAEADFGTDWCKGHFGGYGQRTLGAIADRVGEQTA